MSAEPWLTFLVNMSNTWDHAIPLVISISYEPHMLAPTPTAVNAPHCTGHLHRLHSILDHVFSTHKQLLLGASHKGVPGRKGYAEGCELEALRVTKSSLT